MTVIRGAAARRLAVRTHAQHLAPPVPLPGLLAPVRRGTTHRPAWGGPTGDGSTGDCTSSDC